MTEFDAKRILDPATSESALAQYPDCESRRAAMDAAGRIAVKAMRRQSDEPLTPEQLMGMDGQPIWIEHDADPKYNHVWMIWNNEIGMRHNLAGYNIFWRAYAYQPAHIDREAWEPCEYCNGAKYVYGQAIAVVPNGDKGQIEKEVEGDFDYCPECGRPLTPEAWDMLKKRLRG